MIETTADILYERLMERGVTEVFGMPETLGQRKWEQMAFLGNSEHGCELNPIDFAAFARACGGAGFRMEEIVLDQAEKLA